MSGDLSVGNDPTNVDAVEIADQASIDSAANSQAPQTEPYDAMQAAVDELRGQSDPTTIVQIVPNGDASPTLVVEVAAEEPASPLWDGFEDRAKTLSDGQLEHEIESREFRLIQKRDQLYAAEQTRDNANGVAVGLAFVASIALAARTAVSIFTGLGFGVYGPDAVEHVASTSVRVVSEEIKRMDAEVQALKNEQLRREHAAEHPLGGR